MQELRARVSSAQAEQAEMLQKAQEICTQAEERAAGAERRADRAEDRASKAEAELKVLIVIGHTFLQSDLAYSGMVFLLQPPLHKHVKCLIHKEPIANLWPTVLYKSRRRSGRGLRAAAR